MTLGPRTALDRLIVQIAAAINTRALYTEGHPRAVQAVHAVLEALTAACAERRQAEVTFLIVGDDLVVDQKPMRAGGLFQQNFVQTLRRRGVERLTVARGLGTAECAAFISSMAAGRAPVSSPHVVVGRVEVGEAASGGGEDAGRAEPATEKQLDEGREAFARFRTDRRGSVHKMEEIVWGLMETLARSTRESLALAPLKNHDEYTFVHSVNVALLVLAQARSFGLQGPLLHTLGLAALCHDIGKLSIPLEILNSPGKLEADDWAIMMGHAETGAWQLAALESAPHLSVVVAYEHHLRFDGQPTYPVVSPQWRPTFASQLTSLADTFDAISTLRPYQKARARPAALAILRARSGTFHDPFLVGNFHRLVGLPEAVPGGTPESH